MRKPIISRIVRSILGRSFSFHALSVSSVKIPVKSYESYESYPLRSLEYLDIQFVLKLRTVEVLRLHGDDFPDGT